MAIPSLVDCEVQMVFEADNGLFMHRRVGDHPVVE